MMYYYHLHGDRYLICLRKKYSWESFRKKIKVSPGTYSEIFAKNLYAAVFISCIELGQEYRKYYQEEYETIDQFMFWRYGVSKNICEQIPDANKGYLAVFSIPWRIDDDDLLKKTFDRIFEELDR